MYSGSTIAAMLKRLLLALIALFCAVMSTHTFARQSHEVGAAQRAPMHIAQRSVSMSDAIVRVQRATGGRVLDARDAGDHYRIKVLTSAGEVQIVRVDARTGRIK